MSMTERSFLEIFGCLRRCFVIKYRYNSKKGASKWKYGTFMTAKAIKRA